MLASTAEMFRPAGRDTFARGGKSVQKRHLKPQVSKLPARYAYSEFAARILAFTEYVCCRYG